MECLSRERRSGVGWCTTPAGTPEARVDTRLSPCRRTSSKTFGRVRRPELSVVNGVAWRGSFGRRLGQARSHAQAAGDTVVDAPTFDAGARWSRDCFRFVG